MTWSVARGSLAVSAIVGTVLNGINQGTEIVSGGSINYYKLALTYAVPFLVMTYGAYSTFQRVNVTGERESPKVRQ